MTYKEIVCLANSYKKDPGRCIAGKTLIGYKWIRPISSRIEGELFKEQISFSNGEMPQPLDAIKIPIDIEKPTNCQPENVLISSDTRVQIQPMMSGDKLILRFEIKLVILRREAPKNLDEYRFFPFAFGSGSE